MSRIWYDLYSISPSYRLTLHCHPKGIPEGAEIATRYLTDFDKTAMSFLATYPAGSVVTLASLNISILEHYSNFPDDKERSRSLFWHTFCPEIVRWRTVAAIFGLALDPMAFANQRPSLWHTVSLRTIGSKEFDSRFFRDASRSCQYTVNRRHQTAVAAQCLSFLIRRPFPLYTPLYRILRWKNRPWITRRRKSIPGRGIPRITAELPTLIGSEETLTPSVQLLLSLSFALNYLPALLHSASYSSELIESAKCWWSRRYLHLIFPDETAMAGKAIKDYLIRISGGNRYILFLGYNFFLQH